jgi:hypothetical protein
MLQPEGGFRQYTARAELRSTRSRPWPDAGAALEREGESGRQR